MIDFTELLLAINLTANDLWATKHHIPCWPRKYKE